MTLPLWSVAQAGNALVALAQAAHLPLRRVTPPRSAAFASDAELDTFMEHAALSLGLEAEPLEAFFPDLDAFLSVAAPALFRIGTGPTTRLAAVVTCTKKRAVVLDAEGRLSRVPTATLRAALLDGTHAQAVAECGRLLDGLPRSPARRDRAMDALLRTRLGRDVVATSWSLRQPAGASLRDLVRREGFGRALFALVVTRTLEIGASVTAWMLVGRGALEGRFDAGWIWAWALVLASQIPLRAVSGTLQGRLAIGVGGLLKRRLVAGSLRMPREAIGHEGVGALLGRVLEAEAIEALALNGGFAAITGALSAAATLMVLAFGAAPLATCLVFVGALVAGGVLSWRMFRARERWTHGRIELTHALVENVVGHRTRLAQGRGELHDEEDAALSAYTDDSRRLDRSTVLVRTLVPAGWFLAAILAIGPAFVRGADAVSLAIAVGGIILGHRALARLGSAATELSSAAVAWRRIGGILAEAKLEETGAPSFVAKAGSETEVGPDVIELSDVTFRYRAGNTPTLKGVSLTIAKDDRILLEGPSGGGKSTLASLLAGLHQPESGLVLLRGLDHRALGGHGFRTGVAFAPQFHENHVLSSTFAFNLLLARRWPPAPEDFDDAEAICEELDLGPVLHRMPARMQQTIGDTGWQLSHGEKSRLYLARALLQGASLVVLDESFAALDPETMRKCVACARKRAPALLVIAHP